MKKSSCAAIDHKLRVPSWRRALALLLSALVALPPAAYAQVPVPAGTTPTTVLPNGSGNGVPVVNIAAPNGAGLSHNKFNAYNVPTQGLILNNSNATAVQTQLGGYVLGNPNLAGRAPASLILNEVVQPNRSLLQGYQEVAGQAAQVIVANPYGITCAGCGFINTPRATLTTGTPTLDGAGNLTGFQVRMGDILINGGGLDASGQNYFDLVARSVVLQGQVNAKDLLVAAGSNDFGYLARSLTPVAPSGAAPAYAIDSSLLGGMYVDRIRLIANEAGVGVRLLGNVGASVEDITLNSAGRIELASQMSAQRDVAVTYSGPAQAGAIDVQAGAQAYAGRDLTLAAGAGGVALGAATVGAAGNLSLTGDAIADTGGVANYRFADGAVSVNVAGAANLGGSYDAVGAITVNAASANLGSAALVGRSTLSGVSVVTSGDLEVGSAYLSSPGDVTLSAGGAMTVGAAGYAESGANVAATFAGSFTNSGQVFANNNLSITNSTAGGTLTNAGVLSTGGTLTLGAANLGTLATSAGSQAVAGSLVLNGGTISNAGYVQGDTASVAANATLNNAGTGTMVLGTHSAGATTLTLERLQNQGMVYSSGNLTVDAIQIDNAAGGSLVAGQALTLNANRAVGATGLSNTLTNLGSMDAGSVVLNAPTITFRDGATLGSAYAANNVTVNASALTLGGSLYAGGNLSLVVGSLADTVAGATRAAAGNFSLVATSGISLNDGQVYDAGGTLSVDAPSLQLATTGSTATMLTSGNDISITTGDLDLGGAGAKGSLQAANNVTIAPRSAADLSIAVGAAGGAGGSIQAGGSINATFDHLVVRGEVLANQDIALRTQGGGANREVVTAGSGWLEAGGSLSFSGATAGDRGASVYVNPGTTIAGNALDIFADSTYVAGGGLLQGGQGGGTINTTSLTLAGPTARIIANQWLAGGIPTTNVHIGTAYTNQGLLYAQGNMNVAVMGNITNNGGAAISTGWGALALHTDLGNYANPYQVTNFGLLYGANGIDLRVPEAGSIFNQPGAEIGSGGGSSFLGIHTASGDFASSVFRNEGNMAFVGDATIKAHSFYNSAPIGSVVLNGAWNNVSSVGLGDSGRYDDFLGVLGYDHAHPPIVAAGAGNHNGRPDYQGSGLNGYIVVARGHTLLQDFRTQWTQDEQYTGTAGAATPSISASGTLTILTETGQNRAGSIYGGNVVLEGLYGAGTGTFTNESTELRRRYYNLYGRQVYSCFGATGNDIACTGINAAVYQGNEYLSWTSPLPRPAHWGVDDNVAVEVWSEQIAGSARPASLRAAGSFISRMGNTVNYSPVSAESVAPSTQGATPVASQDASAGRGTASPVQVTSPTTLTVGGVTVNLPTGQNGLFVPSTNPNSGYLIESNPLYASADNPFLGSDYLAGKLGLDPDKQLLRLGDANYEARLVREQILAQTGAAILRTAYDAQEQQQMLMDNASLEATELKLNYGAALTAGQVASLKHDIVWMVEQVVQGKRVLVPVVYLSSATRASMTGATIQADVAVVTGDSFLNRGGKVEGATALVVVTRKDIVNSSGELSGGTVQLQSLEGDIINRTETFRVGGPTNYTTTAGRAGGIHASNSLFMKADRDIDIQGADVTSAGTATLVAGNNVNVTALVLEARKTNVQNTSGMFNRDVTQVQETTQTAQGASIQAGGSLFVGAKNDVNLTGAYVGSTGGTATLLSEGGNVNIGAIALTNTRQESTEHVGFFADSRAGAKPPSGEAAAAPTSGPAQPVPGGRAGQQGTADSNVQRGDKPDYDPNAHSAEAFTGLAITTSQASSTATGNLGSTVQGQGVNIIAQQGDVNLQGSTVTSGAQGTLIDAAGDVNITAAYDTASSTRREDSVRIGVAAEAGPGGAFGGVKVDGSSLDSQRASSTASTSSLTSGGSISIRAGGNLLNEGTSIDAAGNVNVMAATVENRAAQNTTSVNERSTNFDVSLMGGMTTGGLGESISGMVQGSSQELNIAAPEAQLRLQASGGSSETTSSSSTAVVTQIKSGGDTNFQVTGRMLDQGTAFSATGNINLDVGSYENRAATNTSSSSTNTTQGGGTLTVGVDATRSANANLAIQGSNEQTSTSSSTAVTGGLQAGGSVNIRSRGDVTMEGTRVGAGQSVNIDAAGNLNLLQANNTVVTDSKTSQGGASLSASLCVDLSCASAGAGANARTTSLNENTSEGVAGSITGANVNLRSGGNMTMQGTNIAAQQNTTIDAAGKVDFQALTSTTTIRSTADGGGADLSANVGASGKLAQDGGGGGSASFERGRGTTEGTLREGGSITSGGTLTLRSGGDTRLEGTQVQAGSANLNVGGNFTMESAQSTLRQDDNSVSGSIQASGGKSEDGGRSFGGAISLDVTNQAKDNLTNQNAGIRTTGTTTLNVGGDATLAGANIDAGGGVAGRIQGNLTVETRADHEKTEDSSFRGYVGVGNISTSGSGPAPTSRSGRIDAAQDKASNVLNTAGGTGLFIDSASETRDNVTIGQRSGITGGTQGLGGLSVGGNATLIGAQGTQGMNVAGTTTSTSGPETRTQETSSNFEFRGTIASMAGSDQGSGGTFSNVFQASGGQKPNTGAGDANAPVTRPRSGAVSGDAARPIGLAGASSPTTRPRSGAVSGDGARPTNLGGADSPTTRPRSGAVSGDDARPTGLGAPLRPRTDSDALPPRPASSETFGAFQPLPGSKPSAPAAPGTTVKPASAGGLDGGFDNVRSKPAATPPSLGPTANVSPRDGSALAPQPATGGRVLANDGTHVVQQEGATPKPLPRIEITPDTTPLAVKVDAPPPIVVRETPADTLSAPRPPVTQAPKPAVRTADSPPASFPGLGDAPGARGLGVNEVGQGISAANRDGVLSILGARRPAANDPAAPARPTTYGGLPTQSDARRPAKPAADAGLAPVKPAPTVLAAVNPKPAAKPAAPAVSKPAPTAPAGAAPKPSPVSWTPDGKFKLKKLGDEYAGESRGEGQRWKNVGKDYNVKYFTPREQDAAEVVIQGGKFYQKKVDAGGNVVVGGDGKPQLEPLNTRRPGGGEKAIFVMDGQGRIFATNTQKEGEVHHSSLLAGQPVAMGGELKVVDGVLQEINNFSGHYKPDTEQFNLARRHLADQGVPVDKVPARAVTPIYRPEDKGHKAQVMVEFDVGTGKVQTIYPRPDGTRVPVNPDGPVVNGFKLSERVDPNARPFAKVSPVEREAMRVQLNADGDLVLASDPSRKIDTGGPGGLAKFVLDKDGAMFIDVRGSSDPDFNHASMLDGEPARLAGFVEVRDGKLFHMDNLSEHYPASYDQVMSAFHYFDAVGVDKSKMGSVGVFEPHFVDNPDGSKRPVFVHLDTSDPTNVVKVIDHGPPPPVSSGDSAEPRSTLELPAPAAAANDGLRRAA